MIIKLFFLTERLYYYGKNPRVEITRNVFSFVIVVSEYQSEYEFRFTTLESC